ncbi:MAG: AAA family ATPase [Gammaproteobacteria bacterium]|nr:AAA family ATPase [Gammaproteobacteria bacterium]
MSKGSIILLNGTSSAGKTTLARAIQDVSPTPLQHISLDQFRDGMAGRYRGMNSHDNEPGSRGLNIVPVDGMTQLRFGDVGLLTLRGMRRAASAFAATGIDVVVDDLLLEPDFLRDYLEVFVGFEVTFVGVHCDLDTLMARERERPGRFPGTAAAHFKQVHEGCEYDVEVDTVSTTPRECAKRVLAASRDLRSPSAFERLRVGEHSV